MTLFQALKYFIQEALLNLVRGWKVSLVAILTIATSLFLAGIFLLASGNLRRQIEHWYHESKIVVYLEEGTGAADQQILSEQLEEAPWVVGVDRVDSATAHQRFRAAFPSMADLLEGWDDDPLPASLELRLDWQVFDARDNEEGTNGDSWNSWIADLRQHPAISMVDDDRDWLDQLKTVLLMLEGLGLLVGGILLLTAMFTIASVIRLTAYLYRDEIAVMRMVGATEFFIRGPFYMEGLLQGICGGLLASGALLTGYQFVHQGSESLLTTVLLTEFLPPAHLLLLIAAGALAGLAGSVTSLRREHLEETEGGATADE
jgi:cell division transport system permease protein